MSRSQIYAALAVLVAILFLAYVFLEAGGQEIAEGGDTEDAATNPDSEPVTTVEGEVVDEQGG